MSSKTHNFTDEDLELILEIQNVLREQYGEKASEMMVKSDFFDMLEKNREYVYHYDTFYWAEAINDNYLNKQKNQ